MRVIGVGVDSEPGSITARIDESSGSSDGSEFCAVRFEISRQTQYMTVEDLTALEKFFNQAAWDLINAGERQGESK